MTANKQTVVSNIVFICDNKKLQFITLLTAILLLIVITFIIFAVFDVWNNAGSPFLYYICCFSTFPRNFIDFGSGVTICNQIRIRRLDTSRHRARDHSIRHRPLPTYWWSFGTKPLSPAVFEIMGMSHILGQDLDLSGSCDVIGHVTIRLAMVHFLLVVLWTQVSISNGFTNILPQTSCAYRHNAESSLRMRDITWCVTSMWNLSTYFHFSPHFAYSLCHFHWAPKKNKGCSLRDL